MWFQKQFLRPIPKPPLFISKCLHILAFENQSPWRNFHPVLCLLRCSTNLKKIVLIRKRTKGKGYLKFRQMKNHVFSINISIKKKALAFWIKNLTHSNCSYIIGNSMLSSLSHGEKFKIFVSADIHTYVVDMWYFFYLQMLLSKLICKRALYDLTKIKYLYKLNCQKCNRNWPKCFFKFTWFEVISGK